MPRVDGMKGSQGKRWWDFESCTIKRRKEDTRSLHRKILSLFSFFFLLSGFICFQGSFSACKRAGHGVSAGAL